MNVQEQKCSGTHGLQLKRVVLGSFVLSLSLAWTLRLQGKYCVAEAEIRGLRIQMQRVRALPDSRIPRSQVVADLGGTVYMILVYYAFGSPIGWKDETTVSPPAGFTHECGAVTLGQIRKPIHISQECCIRGATAGALLIGLTWHMDRPLGYVRLLQPLTYGPT